MISTSVSELEAKLIDRIADREGVSRSELVRRAVRKEIQAPPQGKLNLTMDPKLATDLLDSAARMGRRSEELVAALLREYLPTLTEDQVDPEKARRSRAQRARELLRLG